MHIYRIAKAAYIDDLSGMGARLYGGRWNEKGVSVIYASESRSLAALEYLVHVPLVLAPRDLAICRFDVPDEVPVTRLRRSRLPADWKVSPPPSATMEIGTRWSRRGKTLLMIVPSVIVPDENNILINPQHPEFRRISKRVEPFAFDPRLYPGRRRYRTETV